MALQSKRFAMSFFLMIRPGRYLFSHEHMIGCIWDDHDWVMIDLDISTVFQVPLSVTTVRLRRTGTLLTEVMVSTYTSTYLYMNDNFLCLKFKCNEIDIKQPLTQEWISYVKYIVTIKQESTCIWNYVDILVLNSIWLYYLIHTRRYLIIDFYDYHETNNAHFYRHFCLCFDHFYWMIFKIFVSAKMESEILSSSCLYVWNLRETLGKSHLFVSSETTTLTESTITPLYRASFQPQNIPFHQVWKWVYMLNP